MLSEPVVFRTMASRSRHLWYLSLLATLLTLSASGDDIYIVRLLFPLKAHSHKLLLDDPNTDFLSARKSVDMNDGGDKHAPDICLVDACIQAGPVYSPLHIAVPGCQATACPCSYLNPPLRC
jgi:hypothetical protein